MIAPLCPNLAEERESEKEAWGRNNFSATSSAPQFSFAPSTPICCPPATGTEMEPSQMSPLEGGSREKCCAALCRYSCCCLHNFSLYNARNRKQQLGLLPKFISPGWKLRRAEEGGGSERGVSPQQLPQEKKCHRVIHGHGQ